MVFYVYYRKFLKQRTPKEDMGKQLIVIVMLLVTLLVVNSCTLIFANREEQSTPQPVQPTKKPVPPPSQPLVQELEVADESILLTGTDAGDKAPPFDLQLMTGKQLFSEEIFEEKAAVIYLFTTYCLQCLEEIESTQQIYPKFKNKVRFVVMSVDEIEDVAALTKFKQSHFYTQLLDIVPKDNDLLATLQITSPNTKIGILKNQTIVFKEATNYNTNDWEDAFKSLI